MNASPAAALRRRKLGSNDISTAMSGHNTEEECSTASPPDLTHQSFDSRLAFALAAVVTMGIALRVYFAVTLFSVLHADEFYQASLYPRSSDPADPCR